MRAYRFPRLRHAGAPGTRGRRVIGGGNTAMDAVRTARRAGRRARATSSTAARGRRCPPARRRSTTPSRRACEFLFLTNPMRILGDETRLGDGRRVPAHGAGRARRLGPAAAGAGRGLGVRDPGADRDRGDRPAPEPDHPGHDAGARTWAQRDGRGRDERAGAPTGRASSPAATSRRGGATVILAMRDGRRAAAAIHEALQETARFVQCEDNRTAGREP